MFSVGDVCCSPYVRAKQTPVRLKRLHFLNFIHKSSRFQFSQRVGRFGGCALLPDVYAGCCPWVCVCVYVHSNCEFCCVVCQRIRRSTALPTTTDYAGHYSIHLRTRAFVEHKVVKHKHSVEASRRQVCYDTLNREFLRDSKHHP